MFSERIKNCDFKDGLMKWDSSIDYTVEEENNFHYARSKKQPDYSTRIIQALDMKNKVSLGEKYQLTLKVRSSSNTSMDSTLVVSSSTLFTDYYEIIIQAQPHYQTLSTLWDLSLILLKN